MQTLLTAAQREVDLVVLLTMGTQNGVQQTSSQQHKTQPLEQLCAFQLRQRQAQSGQQEITEKHPKASGQGIGERQAPSALRDIHGVKVSPLRKAGIIDVDRERHSYAKDQLVF